MRVFFVALLVTALLPTAATAKGPKGPNGTFKGKTGTITLKYLGEGTVSVDLKTKYCTLKSEDGGTFVFPHVAVANKKNQTVLVIFYQPKQIVVYGELPALREGYCRTCKTCKGKGLDVTGTYRRVGK